jgi:hypothetical protein
MRMQPTLVVLAAGVGSRFGGLKQLEPVGPDGSPLMDYTIYDALRGGCGRVVLVIRRGTEDIVQRHLERGMSRRVEVRLVHQELDSLPGGFTPPVTRTKPWGTGHAVLVAAPAIVGPFAVVNADDFYGPDALAAIAGCLATTEVAAGGVQRWAMVGYRLGNTLPASGAVSRGLCRQDEHGELLSLHEVTRIWREGEIAHWVDDQGEPREQSLHTLVSMNLWGFTPALLTRLECELRCFLEARPGDSAELYLPEVVGRAIAAGEARVRVLASEGEWFGITSPGDREVVRSRLKDLVAQGVYPSPLWG